MAKTVISTVALKNLSRRPVRTWCMIFFVFMLAASLFLSSVLVDSMESTIEKTTNRMGADVIVVPKEFEREMADSLFLGELCNFNFDKKWVENIAAVEGVKQASPQLYMETLDAACCSAPVQLVAYDPETDFIITSWLADENIPAPKKGEVIVGSLVTADAEGGNGILLFNELFPVVAHLEKTDTNYDTCVFMTYETAQEIMSSDKWYETFREEPVTDELASTVMIRIEEGVDKKDVARNINFKMDKASPVSAYTTSTIMSEAMEASASMKGYTSVLITVLLILVIVALICVFTITINERTKEFGILASLGASSSKLSGIVITEGLIIGLAGGLIGSAFSTVVLTIFSSTLETLLALPRLNSGISYLLMLGGKCLGLALIVSLAASLYSAYKVSRTNLDTLIKGEEL
ncbi:MAG: FtsX-like permease family protein [Clostridia bacterium]|nr:FtsX-like permease family protein [Clostridia bacterium]